MYISPAHCISLHTVTFSTQLHTFKLLLYPITSLSTQLHSQPSHILLPLHNVSYIHISPLHSYILYISPHTQLHLFTLLFSAHSAISPLAHTNTHTFHITSFFILLAAKTSGDYESHLSGAHSSS